MRRSTTDALIKALKVLAVDIVSDDGVANAAISEAAERMAELREDAERYRWLRTAGAWESEIGLDILAGDPASFDAAVDAKMAAENLGS